MIKTQRPWQVGPTELIEFALDHMHKGSDLDRRLAFLMLDVGVETLFKTFLMLSESVVHFKIKRGERFEAAQGNFHELLRGIKASDPDRACQARVRCQIDREVQISRCRRFRSRR
jgi:hypothetical protein